MAETWRSVFCSSVMNSAAGKAVGQSRQQDCFATACGSTGRAVLCIGAAWQLSAHALNEMKAETTKALHDLVV